MILLIVITKTIVQKHATSGTNKNRQDFFMHDALSPSIVMPMKL